MASSLLSTRRSRWLASCISIAVVTAVAASYALAGSAHRTMACGLIDFAPQSDDLAFNIRSSGARCAQAREVAAASRPRRLRPAGNHAYSADGFSCRGRFVQPRGKDYEHYACSRGRATVTFDRG